MSNDVMNLVALKKMHDKVSGQFTEDVRVYVEELQKYVTVAVDSLLAENEYLAEKVSELEDVVSDLQDQVEYLGGEAE